MQTGNMDGIDAFLKNNPNLDSEVRDYLLKFKDNYNKIQNAKTLSELQNVCKDIGISSDVGAQAAEATSINMLQNLTSEVLARLTAGIDKKDEEIEKKANEVGESTHGSDAEKSAMRELTALDDAKEELVKSKEELTSLMENAREENIGAIQAALEKANSALAKAAK